MPPRGSLNKFLANEHLRRSSLSSGHSNFPDAQHAGSSWENSTTLIEAGPDHGPQTTPVKMLGFGTSHYPAQNTSYGSHDVDGLDRTMGLHGSRSSRGSVGIEPELTDTSVPRGRGRPSPRSKTHSAKGPVYGEKISKTVPHMDGGKMMNPERSDLNRSMSGAIVICDQPKEVRKFYPKQEGNVSVASVNMTAFSDKVIRSLDGFAVKQIFETAGDQENNCSGCVGCTAREGHLIRPAAGHTTQVLRYGQTETNYELQLKSDGILPSPKTPLIEGGGRGRVDTIKHAADCTQYAMEKVHGQVKLSERTLLPRGCAIQVKDNREMQSSGVSTALSTNVGVLDVVAIPKPMVHNASTIISHDCIGAQAIVSPRRSKKPVVGMGSHAESQPKTPRLMRLPVARDPSHDYQNNLFNSRQFYTHFRFENEDLRRSASLPPPKLADRERGDLRSPRLTKKMDGVKFTSSLRLDQPSHDEIRQVYEERMSNDKAFADKCLEMNKVMTTQFVARREIQRRNGHFRSVGVSEALQWE